MPAVGVVSELSTRQTLTAIRYPPRAHVVLSLPEVAGIVSGAVLAQGACGLGELGHSELA